MTSGSASLGGDDDALEECYALYGSTVLAYLRRLVGRDEAEDVLQRTFLDLWRHADRYDQGQSFSGWLFTIAHRRAVDHLRRRRPAVIPVEVLREMMGDDGRETAERFAWAADVRAALTQLPQEQRETIELAYFGDRTQREISRELDVPARHGQGEDGPRHPGAGRPAARPRVLHERHGNREEWAVRHEQIAGDLPALLRGELSRARLAEVVDHLESCEACRLELAGGGRGPQRRDGRGAHAAQDRRRCPCHRRAPSRPGGRAAPVGPAPPPVRGGSRGSRPRWRRWRWSPSDPRRRWTAAPGPSGPPYRCRPPPGTVTGDGSGQVTMRTPGGEHLHDDPHHGLGPAGPGHFYYAWLLDPGTNKMLPLGQVGADGRATFEVDSKLVGSYHAVDVSLQADNGDPGHSDTSVLRAQY